MTDLEVRLFQTHDRAIVDHVVRLVDQLATAVETESGDPASAVLNSCILSEQQLATQLYRAAVLDNHTCFLLETAPDRDGGSDGDIRLDSWLTVPVPADLAPAALQDLMLSSTLVLVPPKLDPPDCTPPNPKGFYFESGKPEDFFSAYASGDLSGRALEIHLETVAAVLGNCDMAGECPGVLGCPT